MDVSRPLPCLIIVLCMARIFGMGEVYSSVVHSCRIWPPDGFGGSTNGDDKSHKSRLTAPSHDALETSLILRMWQQCSRPHDTWPRRLKEVPLALVPHSMQECYIGNVEWHSPVDCIWETYIPRVESRPWVSV